MARSPQTRNGARTVQRRMDELEARLGEAGAARKRPRKPKGARGSAANSATTEGALRLAIDALEQGFALFDAEERLVAYNQAYVGHIWPGLADILAPGVSFETIVETIIERRLSYLLADDPVGFRNEAFKRHRDLPSACDIPFRGGRWVRQRKSRTADGSVVATYVDITELKQKEAAAREAADRQRLLLDTLPDGVVIQVQGGVVYANPAAAHMRKVTTGSELIGCSGLDFVHPDQRGPMLERIRGAIAEKKTLPPIEYTAWFDDGSTYPVETRTTFIDWDGEPATLTVIRDLTERKRAESALRETERRFSAVAANVPGAVYQRVLHPDGRITFPYVSEGVFETHGITAAEVMADAARYLTCVHPDDRERLLERIRASAQTMTPHDIELRIIQPDGPVLWTRSLARPHRRDDGAIVWDGVFVDITEQKRVETALRETERRYEAIAASIPGAVYERVLHTDGSVTFPYISEGVLNTHGIPAAEIMRDGEKLMALLSPDDRTAMVERLKASARTLTPVDMEIRNTRHDGSIVWVRSLARPHRRDDGAVVWDGIFIDITERKLVEEESREAKESAELANRSKSQFLATVSHELRTPLNAIIGFSEILKQEMMGPLGNESYRAYTQDIYDSGKHLLQVINDILDLAKIEAGKLELHLADVDVRNAIESSLRVVKGRAEEKKIELRTRLAETLPKVRADERLLKQILMNLLSNAVKFTPAGGKVRLAVRHHGPDRICISVTDNGIGIAKADLDRVLTPFGQVDSTLSRQYEGTGLGLPLTKSLAELHGGTLTLRSKPGRGTTVAIYLASAG